MATVKPVGMAEKCQWWQISTILQEENQLDKWDRQRGQIWGWGRETKGVSLWFCGFQASRLVHPYDTQNRRPCWLKLYKWSWSQTGHPKNGDTHIPNSHSTTSWSRFWSTAQVGKKYRWDHKTRGHSQSKHEDTLLTDLGTMHRGTSCQNRSCARVWRCISWSWFSKTPGPAEEGNLQFPVTKEPSAS